VRLWRDEEPSQLIFDLMEPERPNIDPAVLEFIKEHVFGRQDEGALGLSIGCRRSPRRYPAVDCRLSSRGFFCCVRGPGCHLLSAAPSVGCVDKRRWLD
jgi:hypothetical protein